MSEMIRPVVCVVDDDGGIRESLRFLFEDAGYVVEEADDGAAALALLREEPRPRVMLLDRMMARVDGVRALQLFDAEPDEVRRRTIIVFMTARNDPPDADVAALIQRHTFASVAKPFDLDALLETVEHAGQRLVERGAQE